MAFESYRLINGQYTTQILDVNAALRHYDQEDREASIRDLDLQEAPTCGLLTQTIVRSPLVHWILPVRLRSPERNDVAFIGDDFVQIKELRPDMQLWDVIRKENFGARIRNAKVIGSTKAFQKDQEDFASTPIKDENGDFLMEVDEQCHGSQHEKNTLPSQIIILQLDTGDSVFLTLRQSKSGDLEFVSSRRRVPKAMLRLQPGVHLAVDPSSRYIAVGCSEHLFTIYAVRPREMALREYPESSHLHHVGQQSMFIIHGIILKMEFLYPSAGDDDHIILLVLYVARNKTRMQLYEWEAGADLSKLRARNHKGYPLVQSRQLPLLLIPLTIKSSFILIYEEVIAVCHGILEGSPKFFDINLNFDPPTSLYHGKGAPLWTSWTRPTRRDAFKVHHDDIYLVREDGILKFLEIDDTLDEFIQADNPVGKLEGNCGTALASLDYHTYGSQSGDLLITGGDSCSGGTYLIRARQAPKFQEPIHNWSPSSDFVTTYIVEEPVITNDYERLRRKRKPGPKPGRIFACSGKGSKGVITEFRHGFEAKLGLEMDYQTPILEAWVLSPNFDCLEDDDEDSLFLLSLIDHSAVLRLSGDASNVADLHQSETKFDLRYRTIAAEMYKGLTVQVTERSIMFMDGLKSHLHERDEILEVVEDGITVGHGLEIDKAVIHEDLVLFTTEVDSSTYLQILEQRDADDMERDGVSLVEPRTNVRTIGKYSRQLTCLSVCRIQQVLYVIVAELRENSTILIFQSVRDADRRELRLASSSHEALVSIAVVYQLSGFLTLLCGTREGHLLTLIVDENALQITGDRNDRLGLSQVFIKRDVQPGSRKLFFVSCDSKIFVLGADHPGSSLSAHERVTRGWNINQVWLTDAKKPGLQQPDVTSVARLRPNLSDGSAGGLLLVAGTELLLTAFSTQSKPVPRYISIGGTPTRLLYSHAMGLLIVGAIVDRKTALLFIDPDTGEDLSVPSEHGTSERVDNIPGLGKFDERIYHLLEWSFAKEKKTWNYIIVATSSGRLLIVTTRSEVPLQGGSSSLDSTKVKAGRSIAFWTRHTFKLPEAAPVYSVTGFPDGLLWCSGNKLLCETLDIKEKKFKRTAEYELPSPATALTYDNGIIYALTSSHSLEVLKLNMDGPEGPGITRTHGDQVTRNTLHHALVNGSPVGRPIHLVSDKRCSVAGLWATQDTKADILETLFEAELPHSILKFRPGRCRPVWDACWTERGKVMGSAEESNRSMGANAPDFVDWFGLSIDGSLSLHTLLSLSEWKYLRFFVDLAIRSSEVCEFTYRDDSVPLDPRTSPKLMMHIDGDILKRCLVERSLEKLLRLNKGDEESIRIFSKFIELQHEMNGLTLVKVGDTAAYVEQAYLDLEKYLRPVF